MKTIVVGSLNTDLVATDLDRFPETGEHVYGKELLIGPGGKSRNIAEMMGRLGESNTVYMIGRTVKDSYGLWKPPFDALKKATVNTDYINIINDEVKLPGIAIIAVDTKGASQIIALPGVSNDFDELDIDNASELFTEVAEGQGGLVLTLECPYETALYAVRKARGLGIKVMLDPGAVQQGTDISELLKSGIYLLKPNEHEAKILTGIEVTGFESAEVAAKKLQEYGIEVVLITHGEHGAYLFTKSSKQHFPIPSIDTTDEIDATGCGDQTMATLCAKLQAGLELEESVRTAILAGTLQFHRHGIKPVTKEELSANC
jgi:ribokinase